MVSIKELGQKIKRAAEHWFVALVVVLTALGSFGLGRLSKIEEARAPIRIDQSRVLAEPTVVTANPTPLAASELRGTTPQYVASKNGAKYYLTSCASAGRIKEENKIYFASAALAAAAAYTPAANCPGL